MLSLRDYQVADLAWYIAQPKCMNLSDPGTGKTPSVVVNQFRRWTYDQRASVWVMPKSLMAKNVDEICRFTPFTREDVAVVDGTKKQVAKALAAEKRILLMGPTRFHACWTELPSQHKAIDVDEFHMCFGGASSKRTESFLKFCRWRDPEMVLMTGTLVNGRLDTAYPAIEAIDPRYYPLGYDQFLADHAFTDEYDRPIAWRNHEKLRVILGRHGIRRTFEDVFGKQSIVFETQWLEMNAKQREIHDRFRDDAFLELDKFIVDGTLPGVATTRARQIMEHPNHFPDLSRPDEKIYIDILNGEKPAKLEALEIHFEDHKRTGKPVIVFAFFVPQQRQIAQLAASMGLRAAVMNGETSTTDRANIDKRFCAGLIDVLICSPGTVSSVGWNWQWAGQQEVDHVINASLSYMDSDFSQGYKRAVRGQRKSPLRVTTMAHYESLDLNVMAIQIRKSRDANLVDPTREILTFNSWQEVSDDVQ